MKWQKKFEVGHKKMDMEHRVFCGLLHDVVTAEVKGASRDKIRRMLSETIKYAEFHFLSEENLMIDIGYPEFEQHHEAHKSLMRDMRKYVVSFESGHHNSKDLANILNNWIEHATSEDVQLSKHIIQA